MRIESIGELDLVETVYEKQDRIAFVTLNREHAGNSFNVQMCDEMEAIWTDFRDDDDVWVAVLSAAGTRFFCTGVDVKESRTCPMGHVWLPIARLMEGIHKPIVCAVNGICCGRPAPRLRHRHHHRIEHAEFFDPHVNVGLVSGWEPIGLSRRIPLNHVLRMTLQEGLPHRRRGGVPHRPDHRGRAGRSPPRAGRGDRAGRPAERATRRAVFEAGDHGGARPRPARRPRALGLHPERGLELRGPEGGRTFEERRAPEWKGR